MVVSPSTVSAKCESSGSCVVSSSCCRSLRQTDRQQRLAGQLLQIPAADGQAAAVSRAAWAQLSGREGSCSCQAGWPHLFQPQFHLAERHSNGMVPSRYWGQRRCLCGGLQQSPLSPGPFTLGNAHLPAGSISQVDTLDSGQLAKGTERPDLTPSIPCFLRTTGLRAS